MERNQTKEKCLSNRRVFLQYKETFQFSATHNDEVFGVRGTDESTMNLVFKQPKCSKCLSKYIGT